MLWPSRRWTRDLTAVYQSLPPDLAHEVTSAPNPYGDNYLIARDNSQKAVWGLTNNGRPGRYASRWIGEDWNAAIVDHEPFADFELGAPFSQGGAGANDENYGTRRTIWGCLHLCEALMMIDAIAGLNDQMKTGVALGTPYDFNNAVLPNGAIPANPTNPVAALYIVCATTPRWELLLANGDGSAAQIITLTQAPEPRLFRKYHIGLDYDPILRVLRAVIDHREVGRMVGARFPKDRISILDTNAPWGGMAMFLQTGTSLQAECSNAWWLPRVTTEIPSRGYLPNQGALN
jgi:hypothetical protein